MLAGEMWVLKVIICDLIFYRILIILFGGKLTEFLISMGSIDWLKYMAVMEF